MPAAYEPVGVASLRRRIARQAGATVGGISSDNYHEIDDVRVWLDPSGGITIKAVTAEGDPVELSAPQAQALADELIRLAAQDAAT